MSSQTIMPKMNIGNLEQICPKYVEELQFLTEKHMWLSYITLLGPSIEFLIREFFKLAYVQAKKEETTSLSFEEFLAKMSKKESKSDISLIDFFTSLEEKRNDKHFRASSKGSEHYILDLIETKLDNTQIIAFASDIGKIAGVRNKINHGDLKGFWEKVAPQINLDLDQTILMRGINIFTSDTQTAYPKIAHLPVSFIIMQLYKSHEIQAYILSLHKKVFEVFNILLDGGEKK